MAFRDLLLDSYLFQHVRQPTRLNNILDLVISSNENMVDDVKVLEHLGNSDHNILVWNLICDVGLIKNQKPYRKYHKADYESMREWFKYIDWTTEFGELEVEEMWQKFCSIINQAIDLFVPLGYNKTRKNPSWMNKSANSARKYKTRMWDRYRQSKSYNDLVEYKIAQNKAVKEYRKAKRQFERKLAKDIKSNPKSFYAYVRSKTKVKEVVGPLRDTSNQLVSDNEVMCEILNEYFGSVFTSEDDINALPEVKHIFDKDSNHMLSKIELTQDIIASKLSKLKINKAPGVDGIVPRFLVENAEVLSIPLLCIYIGNL